MQSAKKNQIIFLFALFFLIPRMLLAVPEAISDLVAAAGDSDGVITLRWTAPGTTTNKFGYLIKYSLNQIDESTFAAATEYPAVFPDPLLPGNPETKTLTGLQADTLYYFAVKAYDNGYQYGYWTASEIVNSSNSCITPSDVPPAAVTAFLVIPGLRRAILKWSAPGDDGTSGNISGGEFLIKYSNTAEITAFNWDNPGHSSVSISTMAVYNTLQTHIITGLALNTTYYFGIKSRDERPGNFSGIDLTSPRPKAIPYNTIPSTFNLLSPPVPTSKNDNVGGDLAFDWEETADNNPGDYVRYTFYISKNPGFSPKTTYSNIAVSSHYVTGLQDNTTYYWKVDAFDSEGESVPSNQQDWKIWVNYLNDVPVSFILLEPLNASTTDNIWPRFSWQQSYHPNPGYSVSYKLYYSTFSSFSSSNVITTVENYYRPPDRLANWVTYYWRVDAVDDDLSVTASGQSFSFYIDYNAPPSTFSALSLLSGTTDNTRPDFRWETSIDEGEIPKYIIRVSSLSGFSPEIVVSNGENTTYKPSAGSPLADNSTYYWTVYTYDVGGNSVTVNQGVMSFIINTANDAPSAFNLATPLSNAATNYLKPFFSWTESFDIDPWDEVRYTLKYSTDSSLVYKTEISSLTVLYYRPDNDLSDNSTYYFNVSAYDKNGGVYTTDTRKYFTNTANDSPSVYTLLSPLNGSTTGQLRPFFSWSESTDPDSLDMVRYILYLSTFQNFQSSNTFLTVTAAYYLPSADLSDNSTYYWKVTAYDLYGASVTIGPELFIVDTVNDLPSAFSTTSPAQNQLKDSLYLSFSWQNSFDIDPFDYIRYEIRASSDSSFANYISSANLFETSISSFGPLTDFSTNYFLVRAYDTRGGVTVSSPSVFFFVNTYNRAPSTFTLLLPAEGAVIFVSTQNFSWQRSYDFDIANTVSYEFRISTSQSFTGRYSTGSLTALSYTPWPDFVLKDNTTYYWTVYATDGSSATPANDIFRIIVDTFNSTPTDFVLVEPESGIIVTSTTIFFDWAAAYDYDPLSFVTYFLEISTENGFLPGGTSVYSTAETYYWLSNLEDASAYYWRVRAVDNNGAGRYSTPAVSTVTIQVDNLLPLPFDIIGLSSGAVIYTPYPVFSWNHTTDPEGEKVDYALFLSNDPGFDVFYSSRGISANAFSFLFALTMNTTYYWKLRASDEKGTFIWASGGVRSFFLSDIIAVSRSFSLVYPSTGAVLRTYNVSFDWEPSSGCFDYSLYYSRDPFFSFFSVVENIPASSYIFTGALSDNQTYYWKVLAKHSDGNDAWSDSSPRIFFLDLANDSPLSFSLLSPFAGENIYSRRVGFSWNSSVDVDPTDMVRYTLYLSTFSIPLSAPGWEAVSVRISSIPGTACNLSFDLSENTTYYWKVRAYDLSGAYSNCAEVNSFFIPALSIPLSPSGITLLNDPDGLRIHLSWTGSSFNQDGSLTDDLAGYRIYRSTALENISVGYYAFVPSSMTAFTDEFVGRKLYYYLVKSVDTSGQESRNNFIVDAVNPGKLYFYSDTGVRIEFAPQAGRKVTSDKVMIKVEKEVTPPSGLYYLYRVLAYDPSNNIIEPYNLSGAATFEFPYDSVYDGETDSMNVFYNRSGSLIKLGTSVSGVSRRLVASFSITGEFRIMPVQRGSEFVLNKVLQRKFTPNGDNINDTVNFLIDNPKGSEIQGKIYSINGDYVAEMKYFESNIYLYWDGKDDKNEDCRKGVYIYAITGEDKNFTGTVILAR